jgi:signal transduction histidine kinase
MVSRKPQPRRPAAGRARTQGKRQRPTTDVDVAAEPSLPALRHFYDAVSHMRQPLVIFDADERLLAFNEAFADLHRQADGTCILRLGMPFHEVAEWRVKTGFQTQIGDGGAVDKNALLLHSKIKGGLPYQLGDGRWMYIDKSQLPNGTNLGVWLDITALKRAEEEGRALEAQLHHSQRLEALGTLAGGIAHDLNTALVPVLALAKLTMRRLPENGREHANLVTILQAAERARDLVHQILAFSRKDAPKRETVDLAALLRACLKMLIASLPATIRIAEAIDDVPPMSGDPGQLHQIVINLVVNAAQAIGDGMGTIAVTLTSAGVGRRQDNAAMSPLIRLSVSDTGCGMDEATTQRIFEPFFTTKSVGEGTGLGLAVVHGIVVGHGGRIDVSSTPGAGTQFDIVLPALDPSTEASPTPAAPTA